jgi:inactivated superfamily I helicase
MERGHLKIGFKGIVKPQKSINALFVNENVKMKLKLMPLINRHILTAFSRILKQKILTLVH